MLKNVGNTSAVHGSGSKANTNDKNKYNVVAVKGFGYFLNDTKLKVHRFTLNLQQDCMLRF